MPIRINYFEDRKGVEYLASGTLTGLEIIAANKQVYTPTVLKELEYKIIDRTDCEEYDVTPDEIKSIVEQDVQASKIKPGFCHLLVSTTQVQYGMSRMWQMLTGEADLDVHHFMDRDQADEYIKERFYSSSHYAPKSILQDKSVDISLNH